MSTERFSRVTTSRATTRATQQLAPVRRVDPRVMTLKKLDDLMRQGHGSGREENYLPWIRVRRRLTSKVSNLFVVPTVLHAKRGLHLLSGLEHKAALLAQWLGATEIREQFPMWPHPHVHPFAGTHPDRDKGLAMMPGLLEIARKSGIKHGNYPGTKIPFVATSDLVLRIGLPPRDRLVFWACKPLDIMLDPERGRTLERLELERLYVVLAGAEPIVVDDSPFRKNLLGPNLDWLTPLHSELRALGSSSRLQDFAHRLDELCKVCPLEDAILRAGSSVGLQQSDAQAYFRFSAWAGLIDIDLSKPIVMGRFAPLGGHRLRQQLVAKLLGVAP